MRIIYDVSLKVLRAILAKTSSDVLRNELNKDEQLRFLSSLDDVGADLVKRSINQYQCQKKIIGLKNIILLNIGSFAVLLVAVPIFVLNYLFRYKKYDYVNEAGKKAVYFGTDLVLIPKILQDEFSIVICNKSLMLNFQDFKFILFNLFNTIYSPYFVLKCIIKIAFYRANIFEFTPKAMIVNSEYSFTSSLLTKYCTFNDILHINLMHGEKLFNMIDSFSYFHRFYIWDEYYKGLFTRLKSDAGQFIVALPEVFVFDASKTGKDDIKSNFLTYYLIGEDKDRLFTIKSILDKLAYKYRIYIRPHPRCSDLDVVNKIFCDFNVEDINNVSILDSIEKAGFAVSTYSTVLFQAYLYGKTVIIDDLSYKDTCTKLKDLEYHMLDKSHLLLSDLLNKVIEKS